MVFCPMLINCDYPDGVLMYIASVAYEDDPNDSNQFLNTSYIPSIPDKIPAMSDEYLEFTSIPKKWGATSLNSNFPIEGFGVCWQGLSFFPQGIAQFQSNVIGWPNNTFRIWFIIKHPMWEDILFSADYTMNSNYILTVGLDISFDMQSISTSVKDDAYSNAQINIIKGFVKRSQPLDIFRNNTLKPVTCPNSGFTGQCLETSDPNSAIVNAMTCNNGWPVSTKSNWYWQNFCAPEGSKRCHNKVLQTCQSNKWVSNTSDTQCANTPHPVTFTRWNSEADLQIEFCTPWTPFIYSLSATKSRSNPFTSILEYKFDDYIHGRIFLKITDKRVLTNENSLAPLEKCYVKVNVILGILRTINSSTTDVEATINYGKPQMSYYVQGTNPPTLPTGSVNIISDVSGADIYLDGELVGITSTSITIPNIISGDRVFVIRKSGLKTVDKLVTIITGQTTTVDCKFTDDNRTGTINITSNVSDANVYLNNEFKGKATPTISLTKLQPSTYTLKVTHSGYSDYTQSVTVIGDRTNTISCILQPIVNLYGHLTVVSNAANSSVFIDGTYAGVANKNFVKNKIPLGNHSLKVTCSGYTDYNGSFEITNRKRTMVRVKLVYTSNIANVNFNANEIISNSSGTSIQPVKGVICAWYFKDRKNTQKIIINKNIADTLSFPCGRHRFVFKKSGYKTISIVCNLAAPTTYDFSFNMTRI